MARRSLGTANESRKASKLAIHGGTPYVTAPQSSWPRFEDDEIWAVEQVLKSGKVNYWGGTRVAAFERAFAEYCGTRFGVAVANGTLALELALIAFDIGPGDEVIVTPRSFFASTSCVVARGATPVFADVIPKSGNLSAETIERCIGPKTKAAIVVHLAGWPCDMDPICDLARHHGFVVIEDCAQAHGALYRGRPVGGIGDAGCFSFCQDKIMTTGGEGGLFVTNDDSAWKKAWSYKDHGKSYAAAFRDYPDSGFRWLHQSFGSNWRLTEMQAAVALCQLDKLSGWVARRQRNAQSLAACLNEYEAVRPPAYPSDISPACYKYYTYVNESAVKPGLGRDWIREALCAEGLVVIDGVCPEIYREAAFDHYPSLRPRTRLPIAEALGRTSLMFQVDHTLCDGDIASTCDAVRKVMDYASA